MTIVLNHTIIPAHNKEASAQFFAQIMGLKMEPSVSHFIVVRINDTLTFDFANKEAFEPHHYAFHVSDSEFDAILARIQEAKISYSSDPMHQNPGQLNRRRGGRGFYFLDLNGHNLELMTRV